MNPVYHARIFDFGGILSHQTHTIFCEAFSHIDLAISTPVGFKGASFIVDVVTEGDLGSEGFVVDFSILKKDAKKFLDSKVDHVLYISKNYIQNVTELNGEQCLLAQRDSWSYKAPSCAFLVTEQHEASKDSLEREINNLAKKHLPSKTYGNVKFALREEVGAEGSSFFNYTHGLTRHKGACQRLFHGHRSQIEVLLDGVKSVSIEKKIINDLLAGGSVHIVSRDQLKHDDSTGSNPKVGIEYTAPEGTFAGDVPREKCLFVEEQTSIEFLAQTLGKYVVETLGISQQNVSIKVFEGVSKGAVFSHRV